jgi:hypothetical protein
MDANERMKKHVNVDEWVAMFEEIGLDHPVRNFEQSRNRRSKNACGSRVHVM